MERIIRQIDRGKGEQRSPYWTRPLKRSVCHERCDRDAQRISNSTDVEHAHIALAAFDLSHVGTIDAGGVGKSFLRQPALVADRTNSCAKAAQFSIGVSVDRLAGHIFLVARCALIGHGIYDPVSN